MAKKTPPPSPPASFASGIHNSRYIDTRSLRDLLVRLSDAALALDLVDSHEKAAKISTAMINLTKTIRETESYNQSCLLEQDSSPSGTLDERLKGYYPSPSELETLELRLKDQLERLLPRLIEAKGETQEETRETGEPRE